jgi:hypothetical protein
MYIGFTKFVIITLAATSLGGCAGRGNDWPSLMTPEELRTGKPASQAAAVTPEPASKAAAPVAPPAPPAESPVPAVDSAAAALLRAQVARLNEARRDAAYIRERWQKQQSALKQSLAAIKIKGPADSAWNKAQLELTRLNQIAAEWDDLETVLSAIAGQLAVAAYSQADVRAPLAETGALLAEAAKDSKAAAAFSLASTRQISR